MATGISCEADLISLLKVAVQQLRQFLSVDRVKVYRFAADQSGEVIAESTVLERLPSLLGLHFPASDIPDYARKRYINDGYRIIVDVAAKRKILHLHREPNHPGTGQQLPPEYEPVDPCHIQYLLAMGVMSSLTAPIKYQDRLWGLLVVHHSQPRRFGEAELHTVQFVANQIAVAIAQARLAKQAQEQMFRLEVLDDLGTLLDSRDDLRQVWPVLLLRCLTALQADGGRLYLSSDPTGHPSEQYEVGVQPSSTTLDSHPVWQQLLKGARLLSGQQGQTSPSSTIWASHDRPSPSPSLGTAIATQTPIQQSLIPQSRTQSRITTNTGFNDTADGAFASYAIAELKDNPHLSALAAAFADTTIQSLLFIPLRYRSQWVGGMVFFREEQTFETFWAGRTDDDRRNHLPRESFAAWCSVQHKAPDWQDAEIALARDLGRLIYTRVTQQRIDRLIRNRTAYDMLTGLPNWLLFDQQLALALVRVLQDGNLLAVAVLDLDRFKGINEIFGHGVGDYLLQQVSARLQVVIEDRHPLLTVSSPETPSSNLPSSDLPSSDLPSSDPPSSDLPSSDPPSSDRPSLDRPSLDLPSSDLPTLDPPSSGLSLSTATDATQTSATQTSATQTSDRRSQNHAARQRLSRSLLARWHGDGFTLMLQNIGYADEAVEIAQRLLQIFQEPFYVQGQAVYLTASMGIALAPYDGDTAEMLLKHAESAMHRAKSDGKNTYRLYCADFDDQAWERVILQSDLHKALEQQEFVLRYQPQIHLQTGDLIGVEALIRWHHPRLGMISPDRFIPIAEEIGTIDALGEWVLRTACNQHQAWQAAGLPPLRIAVNVSARQLRQGDFAQRVMTIIRECGVDPQWVELEITESTAMDQVDVAIATFQTLAQNGMQIAIDDFGAGYSCLNSIKQFPCHTLKIDRCFINDLLADSRALAITQTIIALAQGLGLDLVAEGVETVEQAERLQQLNCGVGQGYLFGRPLSSPELMELVRAAPWRKQLTFPQVSLPPVAMTPPGTAPSPNTDPDGGLAQAQAAPSALEPPKSSPAPSASPPHSRSWPTSSDLAGQRPGSPSPSGARSHPPSSPTPGSLEALHQGSQDSQTEIITEIIIDSGSLPSESRDPAESAQATGAALATLTSAVNKIEFDQSEAIARIEVNRSEVDKMGVGMDVGHPTPQLQRQIQEYEALQQKLLLQVRREQLLGDILRRIRQSLNLDEILQSTADEVQQFLQADRVVLFQFDGQWNGTIAVEAVANTQFSMLGVTIDEPCFRDRYVQHYRQGRMRAINDIDQAGISPCHHNLLTQYQVRANLVVPVIYSDRLWGLVIAHHCTGPRAWKQSELRLLAQLADQVAIAIYQGELYRRLATANQELQELSSRDALTGLANRRQFDQVLTQEWRRLTRVGQPLALLLVDVDFFKQYNDTYGHPAGDECLQRIAQLLANALHRSADLGARYGGEEFALVLPNTPLAGAEQLAQRIREAIHAAHIPHAQSSVTHHVTLSIGIGVMVPTVQHTPEVLIQAADQALYQAKHQGRDRWCVWPNEP